MAEEERLCSDSGCDKSSCSGCPSAQGGAGFEPEAPALLSDTKIKHIIGVVSGKGGVGKSLVTSMLASRMQKAGKKVAIMDADITGPSIPHVFGLDEARINVDEEGIIPAKTASGMPVLSANLLLPDNTDPVIWRGPVVSGVINQFYTQAHWGEVDYMFVDMPPGTGDVPLTVFQSMPVDGIVIVATPQELVSMIVQKAVKMAEHMDVKVLGLVENMSYLTCPDCGKKIYLFGESHIEAIAAAHNIPVTASIPMDPAIASACDAGQVETLEAAELDPVVESLAQL